jgi:hypothetical protein
MSELQARWDIHIIRSDNGYRCNWIEEVDEDHERIMEMVFEEEGSEHGEIEAFQRLLWFITEHFGMVGSKHDEKRIRVEIDNEVA